MRLGVPARVCHGVYGGKNAFRREKHIQELDCAGEILTVRLVWVTGPCDPPRAKPRHLAQIRAYSANAAPGTRSPPAQANVLACISFTPKILSGACKHGEIPRPESPG